jgi:hypothetical protein
MEAVSMALSQKEGLKKKISKMSYPKLYKMKAR